MTMSTTTYLPIAPMTADCCTAEVLLAVGNDLERADRARLQAHLGACARCAAAAAIVLCDEPPPRRRVTTYTVVAVLAAAAGLLLVARWAPPETSLPTITPAAPPVAAPAPEPARPAGPPAPAERQSVDVMRVVDASRSELRACAKLEGTDDEVVVEMTILASGEPHGVKADRDSPAARCVVAVFAKLRFPPAKEPITIFYPVVLQRGPAKQVAGGRARADLSRAIGSRRAAVAACGPKHRYRGKVVVKLVIAPSGEVRSAVAEPDTAAGRCVANALSDLQFAPAAAATTLRYPFVLR
jgi:hypothetical protein